jgi:hypothetical protein
MTRPVHHMNFAGGIGLMHAKCSTCNAETLHKHGKCVHCAGEMARRTQPRDWTMDDTITRQATLARARANGVKARRLVSV